MRMSKLTQGFFISDVVQGRYETFSCLVFWGVIARFAWRREGGRGVGEPEDKRWDISVGWKSIDYAPEKVLGFSSES